VSDRSVKTVVAVGILLVILYGIKNSYKENIYKIKRASNKKLEHNRTFVDVYSYVLYVINSGSNTLHLKGGEMEGGYVSKDIAPKVACFVAKELQKSSCPIEPSKDAQMYFTSSCGGCHQSDGTGIKGTYPDLTKPLHFIVSQTAILKVK